MIKSRIRKFLHWWQLKEWQRQAITQPFHVIATYYGMWLFNLVFTMQLSAVLVVMLVIYREAKQFPSSRWFDPPLDIIFQLLGIFIFIMKHSS